MEYGQKFLNETSVKMQKFIKNFVTQIIGQNKNKNEPLIKYENLIKIYLNQEALLEELLDFILEKDDSCDSSIIHRLYISNCRRIELYLDKLQTLKLNEDAKKGVIEQIINILKLRKYQNKIDKNYVLMLFKMHNFTNGIVILSEILELRQELLSIYMDSHEYDKIINICENFGRAVKDLNLNLGKQLLDPGIKLFH